MVIQGSAPSVRRLMAALLIAVSAVGFGYRIAAIVTDPTVICASLTPDDWPWWWLYGCKDGGSSGAGD